MTDNYSLLASQQQIKVVSQSLSDKGYEVTVVKSGKEALETIKSTIPDGASVMNGTSVTLEQVGYLKHLKSGDHKWKDLHLAITSESDKEKRVKLRRQATLADYYLGSVHALTVGGEFVVASNTASQIPLVAYTAANLIFVVSTKKIVNNLEEAMTRLNKHVYPLEDKQSLEKYGSGTSMNKILIFKGEASSNNRKINFILVEEDLGF